MPVADGGASLVVVLVTLPVLILFAALAVDTANWFVHKRHLQTQADSAALAAAQDLQFPCTPVAAGVDPGTVPPNSVVRTSAHLYDGTTVSGYNQQVANDRGQGPVAKDFSSPWSSSHGIFSGLNQPTFYDQPNNPPTPDPYHADDPCRDKAVDIKLTETNVPWFFKLAGVRYINAQATVKSYSQTFSPGGQLPLGIPLPPDVKAVSVQFVDENGGTIGSVQPLAAPTPANPHWSATGVTLTTPNSASRVGMDVIIKDAANNTRTYLDGSTGVSLLHPYVATGASPGAAAGAPEARRASIAGCALFTTSTQTCTASLTLGVEFSAGVTCNDVSLEVNTKAMTCPGTGNGSPNGDWVSPNAATVDVQPNSGARNFTVTWKQTKGSVGGTACGTGGNACSGTFGVVARVVAGATDLGNTATSASGPISNITLSPDPAGSVLRGTSVFSVDVDLWSLSSTQKITDPYTRLHLDGSQGNQALSCTNNQGNKDFGASITNGCTGPFTINPAPVDPNPTCVAVAPYDCVTSNPGGGKSFQPELNNRIGCSPNYWTATNAVSDLANSSDPRLVHLFLMLPGSFDNTSGAKDKAIVGFASFYITGADMDGVPNGARCQVKSAGDAPVADGKWPDGRTRFKVKEDPVILRSGEIVGHFVKQDIPGQVPPMPTDCVAVVIGDCTTVLTK